MRPVEALLLLATVLVFMTLAVRLPRALRWLRRRQLMVQIWSSKRSGSSQSRSSLIRPSEMAPQEGGRSPVAASA